MRIYLPRLARPQLLAVWQLPYRAQAIWIAPATTASTLSHLFQRRLSLLERLSVHSTVCSARHLSLNHCTMGCVQPVLIMARPLRLLKMMTSQFPWKLSRCSISGPMGHHILESFRQWTDLLLFLICQLAASWSRRRF